MTKDEAAKIWDASPNDFLEPVDIIDKFVRLGILKLDEPKTATNKFADILARYFPGPEVEEVWAAIEEANLKIVEK